MNRKLWLQSYWKGHLPRWPCPGCHAEALVEDVSSQIVAESAESAQLRHTEDWDPEWTEKRCAVLLRCGACQDAAIAVGHFSVELSQFDGNYDDTFVPAATYPALPVVAVPKTCDKSIKAEVRAAEALIWLSPTSACARLRTAIERLLDELGVQRFTVSKGKRYRLHLHARILKLPPKHQGIRDHLLAVKWIGNEGAHETALRLEDVLDGLEVLEYALDRIYDPRSRNVKKIVRGVLKKKGSRWR